MRKKKIALKIVFFVILVLSVGINIYLIYGENNGLVTQKVGNTSQGDTLLEEYVWLATMTAHPMYVANDQVALREFGINMGVKVTIEGPKEYDIPGQVAAIEEVIKRKPAGIMILGMERSLIPMVNKAVEAEIPTITVDADLVESKRLAHVGSNWYNIGVKQAEAMVKLVGGKGKVAMLGIGGADNMEQGFEGFKNVMKDYPDIMILGEYDDMSDVEESKRITLELVKNYPDIAGIAGFDANSGPGIGEAIKELNLVGKIKVTCVDIEPVHLQLLKEGVIQKLIGQKRKLFTYYGARLLYDLNHATISITADDEKNGVTPIPYIIDTGLIEVDLTNVDSIIEGLQLN